MASVDAGGTSRTTLPQGDLRLLQGPVARRLLASTVPARFAYLALDGTPRIPTWCHWTGDELVMPAFLSAPHVRHPVRRLEALRARPQVAVSIDTEGFPPKVLLIRGVVDVTEVEGVPSEYRAAAIRYLGEAEAAAYLSTIDRPGTRMARIALRPSWVGVVDFRTRQPSALEGVEPEVRS